MASLPPSAKRIKTDERLVPRPRTNWRVGKTHPIHAYDYVDIAPISFTKGTFPNLLEFSVSSEKLFLSGPFTRFHIGGQFEKAKTENGQEVWTSAEVTDVAKNTLAPNWLELLIKSFRVYQDNKEVKTSNEPDHVMGHLNAFFYANMDKEALKELTRGCKAHPAYSVSQLWNKHGTEGTALTAGDVWRQSYGSAIFAENGFDFEWIPALVFPFWQGRGFPLDQYDSTAIPLPSFAKPLEIQIMFNEDVSKVIRGSDKFRLKLTKFFLRVEQPRLSPNIERVLLGKLKRCSFRGVTKILLAESIPTGVLMHRVRFHNIDLPDGLFMFALPRSVIGGTFDYSLTSGGKDLFLQHHIQKLELTFGGKDFFQKEPHYGTIDMAVIENKISLDHRHAPPFGVPLNPDLVTPALVADGCNTTAFPHVYLNLRNFPDGLRIVPLLDDGSIINNKKDLDLTLRFKPPGAVADATYMIYAFYEDHYLDMDCDARGEVRFSNPYLYKSG